MAYRSITRREEGIALITVIGLLVVFMLLGMAWVNYMAIETQQSDFQVNKIRTRYAAIGGVNAAIAEIQAAMAAGTPVDLAKAREFEVPWYKGGDEAPVAAENRTFRVTVGVSDENARININCAPPNVLREILGVPGEKARQIRSSLPRVEGGSEAAAAGERHWFASVDELAVRGLVDEAALSPELRSYLTVYTVPDPSRPAGYMNVNTAPAPVLEALLDVTPDVAGRVIAARTERPFSDVTELSAAAGKDPATFNVRPEPDALNTLPAELSFSSRCYRITSTADLVHIMEGAVDDRVDRERVEAVVYIEADGSAKIMYWNESAPRDDSSAAQVAGPEGSPAQAE